MLQTEYTFQENSGDLLDHTGNGNDSVSVNGVTQGATGILGNTAYDFDGTDDWVELPDTYDRSQSNTIAMWLYPNDTSTGQGIWGTESTNDGDRTFFQIGFVSGEARIFAESPGGTNYTASTSVTANEWVHLVGILDYGASELRLHKNGREVATTSFISSGGDLGANQSVGRNGGGGGSDYYDGKVGSLRIWDHVLDPREIYYLYSVGETGAILTETKTHGSAVSPDLRVDVTLNSQSADAYVIGSPGTASQEVQHTALSDGSNDYSLTWSNTHTDFRVQVVTGIAVENRVSVNRTALLV